MMTYTKPQPSFTVETASHVVHSPQPKKPPAELGDTVERKLNLIAKTLRMERLPFSRDILS